MREFFLKTEEEGKKALDDLKETFDDKKGEIETLIDNNVKSVIEKTGLASVDEMKALKDEIAALKKEISDLKK